MQEPNKECVQGTWCKLVQGPISFGIGLHEQNFVYFNNWNGYITYFILCTQFNVLYALNMLSICQSNPKESNWIAGKKNPQVLEKN